MIGEYFCPYLLNTGKAHGVPCMRPEGCHLHWKAKPRIPCSECASLNHTKNFWVSRDHTAVNYFKQWNKQTSEPRKWIKKDEILARAVDLYGEKSAGMGKEVPETRLKAVVRIFGIFVSDSGFSTSFVRKTRTKDGCKFFHCDWGQYVGVPLIFNT
ncbi:hypothetical protein C1645_742265 [Glomus cerebriforme]|uniref:Uncharacterized protein n=1 Tax=Glomus cerebriforme TaxID=658196 RepID=A0A397SE49_9GLOM|nr:hypothetical protein C1645_742265 [Glomus cerebriforme]